MSRTRNAYIPENSPLVEDLILDRISRDQERAVLYTEFPSLGARVSGFSFDLDSDVMSIIFDERY